MSDRFTNRGTYFMPRKIGLAKAREPAFFEKREPRFTGE